MKIAAKLLLSFVACAAPAVAWATYAGARREVERYEADLVAHQAATGRALRPSLLDAWQREGEARALALLEFSDRRIQDVDIRWVWLRDDAPPARRPGVEVARLGRVARGAEQTVILAPPGGPRRAYTYVPVSRTEGPGAIEVSEALAREGAIVRGAVLGQVAATCAAVLLAGALTGLLSAAIVARPVRAIRELARRVGAGELSARLAVRGDDELAELARDIDAMAEALERTIGQLRHADRLTTVGELASGLAHELGTPLNVTAMRAKMIASGEVTGDEAREYARNVAAQAERMTNIVRQLLDFARRREPRRVPTDLGAVARQVEQMLATFSRARGVAVEIVPGPAVIAEIDAGQLEQVLTNLVVNAVQASTRDARVTVSVSEDACRAPAGLGADTPARCASVRVEDHGHGIDADDVGRVFEPFFTTKGVGEGTGLGLSVAWGIARDHGGWIDVESVKGRGSAFTLRIPTEARA